VYELPGKIYISACGKDSSNMKNRDFIIISLNPWYTPLSSTSKYVARELARQNRVLYVNPPLDRKTLMTRRKDPVLQEHLDIVRGGGDPLIEIAPNLWNYYPRTILESINWIPWTSLFSRFNLINNKRIAASIFYAIEQLGFNDFILINDKDLFRGYYLKELLRPRIYLYYDRDYILGVDYWRKHGATLEPKLAEKSDLIVTHSDYLMGLLKPHNANIYNVGSGIDISLFDAAREYAVPAELRSLKRPVVGYVGALTSSRLDVEAFVRIAQEKPGWTMVLVGPEDEVFKNSELHRLPNVVFCGRRPIGEIPAYIDSMDVCLNPQVINDITIGNYPLKIDEYLAMGKPVVATQTIGMKPFQEYVYLAEPGGDYISLIEKAFNEDSPQERQRRIAYARSHSWKNILDNIYGAIENTMIQYNGYSN
jgi:glycosyltransferase involved in cell wall biosynthesis